MHLFFRKKPKQTGVSPFACAADVKTFGLKTGVFVVGLGIVFLFSSSDSRQNVSTFIYGSLFYPVASSGKMCANWLTFLSKWGADHLLYFLNAPFCVQFRLVGAV